MCAATEGDLDCSGGQRFCFCAKSGDRTVGIVGTLFCEAASYQNNDGQLEQFCVDASHCCEPPLPVGSGICVQPC